jgi:hypothetical protein
MNFIDPARLLEIENHNHIQMANSDREVLYSHNHSMGEYTASPTITRYHRGPWRPASRQFVFGSQSFSHWQSLHGTHTRANPLDRTNLKRAQAKPIRLWDRGAFPSSTPLTTYYSNPSQLMAGNVDPSGNQYVTSQQLPLTAQGG